MPVKASISVQGLMSLARQKAEKFGVDGDLICALVEQESNWNPYAMRYEPAFYSRYVQPQGGLGTTEMTSRATSWGLMQVMGQVARELGFSGPFLSALCDPEIGLEWGCRKFSIVMGKTGNHVDAALQCYNGGSNALYAQQVKSRIATYNS